MSEHVLLDDALRAREGESRTYTAPDPLGAAAIRYFATAVGDLNPLYLDAAFARSHGHPDVIAPPTLLAETNQYMTGGRDADGYLGHSWHLDIPDTRLVRGGNAYEFGAHAGPGTVVTATWRIAGMSQRRTGAGVPMLVLDSEAAYTDQHGTLLLVNRESLVFTSLRPVEAPGERPARTPRPDVSVEAEGVAAQQITPLTRRIELPDMIAYAGATWDWHRLHYDPEYLAAKKLPAPVVDGQVFGALLVEAVQDHFGPTATVRTTSFRFKNLVFAGETVQVTGRVVASEAGEGGAVLTVEASVDVVGENARTAAAPASLTVEVAG